MDQKIDPYPAGTPVTQAHTAWQFVRSSWQSNYRFPAYLFFSIVSVLTASFVAIDLVFNYWYYYFYDVLYYYDKHGVIRLLLVFSMLTFFYFVFSGYSYFVRQMSRQPWKRWLTKQFVGRLLQRPAVDSVQVDSVVSLSVELSMRLIRIITTFLVLMYVLWLLSDPVSLSLGRFGQISLPGYFVWAGVIYGVVATFYAFKLGRPFLALQQGKWRQKLFSRFALGCYQVSVILPLLVALPGCFEKVFLISWLIQSLQAFNRVQGSLSFTEPSSHFDD